MIITPKDSNDAKRLSAMVKKKQLRRVHRGIYTDDMSNPIHEIVQTSWPTLLPILVPGGILSHRSAIELAPIKLQADKQIIFMTSSYYKTIALPGLTIKVIKGDVLQGVEQLMPALAKSDFSRALLENLSRVRGRPLELSKTLSQSALEKILAREMRLRGENHLNEIRDKAKAVAGLLNMDAAFQRLNDIIALLLSTHEGGLMLMSDYARSIANQIPYDENRVALFEKLYLMLKPLQLCNRPYKYSKQSFQNLSFFEAYFSNYIEGTEFVIDEAEDIVFKQEEIADRHADSHDVLANFNLTNHFHDISVTPGTADEFITLLRERHTYLMQARPDKYPGDFKKKNNQAGNTDFVDKDEVLGTLAKAFEYHSYLAPGLARALYIHFVLTEVHPFEDGNGRMARIMLNAELVSVNEYKVMIPTVHRDNYLSGLRLASRQGDFTTYIKVMDQAHAYTESINWHDYAEARAKIEADYADKTSDEGIPIFNRALRQLKLSV